MDDIIVADEEMTIDKGEVIGLLGGGKAPADRRADLGPITEGLATLLGNETSVQQRVTPA